MALAAVLAIVHGSHEDTSTASIGGALSPQALDLAVAVNLVVLEHSQFGLLALVLDLLGCSVDLLLALLGHTTAESEDEVEGRLLLDVVVGEGAAVFELLAGEDQALLVWGNAFLVYRLLESAWSLVRRAGLSHTLDLGFHIVDGVRRLHLEGDGLTREGLDENLHDGLGVSVGVLRWELLGSIPQELVSPKSSVGFWWEQVKSLEAQHISGCAGVG
jgi:hypothetical protein